MARVLVVDDDSWAQRMLAAVLAQVGHQVGMAADAREGLLAADHVQPQLLIVKTRLPGLDGWELVARLRTRPELAAVPALFLVSGPASGRRGASFRPETDDILVKPFSAEALQAKVEGLMQGSRTGGSGTRDMGQALADPSMGSGVPNAPQSENPSGPSRPNITPEQRPRRATPAGTRPPRRPTPAGVALVGRLDEFGAASILMLLELERRSGVLILSGAPGTGRVQVRRGRVLRATIEDRPECRAAPAVFEMLTWSEGRFEFHPGEVEGEDEVRSSTSFLLLEAARKQDEAAAATKRQN